MDELSQRAADLLIALLGYTQALADEHIDAQFLPEAHATILGAQNLIEALRVGRVRMVKTDTWSEW